MGEGSDPCNPLPLTRRASACKRGGEPRIKDWDTSVQDKVSSGDKLHHEDLAIGKPYECGTKTVTKDEIMAFGRAWDPQPLHVDEEAAKKTLVGGLCASGWHTASAWMKLRCACEFDTLVMRLRGKRSAIHRLSEPQPQPSSSTCWPSASSARSQVACNAAASAASRSVTPPGHQQLLYLR